MAKPTFEQLIAYAAGDLAPEEARPIESHLDSDPSAAATVESYRAAHRLVASDDGVDPPPALIKRAKAIFAARGTMPSPRSKVSDWLASVDRLIATLVYDSRLQPATVRFAGDEDSVTLRFETDRGEVDLHAARNEREGSTMTWRILGRIDERDTAMPVDLGFLTCDGESVVEAECDAEGRFELNVQPGEYELLIRRERGVSVLGPIQLV